MKLPMQLQTLLKLQLSYCLLGILFNVASWIFLINGAQTLTPTLPASGLVVMAIYGLFLLSGYFKQIKLYRFLMLISVLIFGYNGIWKHVLTLQESPELYYAIGSGLLGILINVYGCILNTLAVFGLFVWDNEKIHKGMND